MFYLEYVLLLLLDILSFISKQTESSLSYCDKDKLKKRDKRWSKSGKLGKTNERTPNNILALLFADVKIPKELLNEME